MRWLRHGGIQESVSERHKGAVPELPYWMHFPFFTPNDAQAGQLVHVHLGAQRMRYIQMKKRRVKKSAPIMLFWSKRDQQRFIESVERFQSMVNDLATILEPAKLRKKVKAAAAPAEAAAVAACPKCKAVFDATRDRCPSCGQAFSGFQSPSTASPSSKRKGG